MMQNPILVPGVHRYSRTQMKKLGKKKKNGMKDQAEAKEKLVKEKLGEQDLLLKGILHKPIPRKIRKSTKHPKKIRASIKPGTICIILSGRYAGKRVVNLKALDSGLLLVTGPFKVNGVPLRRLNQSNVIATSTTIDISKLSEFKSVDDSYFKESLPHYFKRISGKKSADSSGKSEKDSPAIQHRFKTQQAVDSELMSCIKNTPNLRSYLAQKFSLSKGQYPHLMKF